MDVGTKSMRARCGTLRHHHMQHRAGFIVKRAVRPIAGVKGVAFALADERARCYCLCSWVKKICWHL